jgi:hypothetical protein
MRHKVILSTVLCLSFLALAAAPDPIALKIQGPDTLGNSVPVFVNGQSGTGSLQTPVTASSTGAASAITASLPGVAGKTTYITGFQVTGGGATGASIIVVTVTGLVTGTNSYDVGVVAGATAGTPNLIVTFPTPIPASAVNTAIVVNVPSFGAGNTNSAVSAQGFQQ